MLNDLVELEFTPRRASPLQKLCQAGSEYGLRILERTVSLELLSLLGPRAKQRIRNHLRQILARASRPCIALELEAFRSAYQAIYPQQLFSAPELIEKKFLGERPCGRLISLFNKFPVLAELWCQLTHQWCDSISELLERVEADKQRVSRVFCGGQPLGRIIDLRAGLSDPHNRGRTVMRVQFEAGSIIYKPRAGDGEQEWFELISYLNAASLRPKLTAARVFCRDGYCWMQEVRFAPCKDYAAARRFYKRLGAIISIAYLLRAVDCHRDNIIASSEHPVLVDAETLRHVADDRKMKDFTDPLYATGFLPSSERRSSYQYRSSTVGKTAPGRHTPHVGGNPLTAESYEDEIVSGFRAAWRCVLRTRVRRAAFGRRLQRFGRRQWRHIYWSTGNYDTIMQACVQPIALRSGIDRDLAIARLCTRSGVSPTVIRKEIDALRRLDIPYFIRRAIAQSPVPEDKAVPPEIIEALRRAVRL
jgi:lantibiotic modifying enzyme